MPSDRAANSGSPSTPPPSDLALVRAIRAGNTDRSAWQSLLSRYQDRLFAVCLRMVGNPETAADLCQDALVKIIQGLGSYDERSSLATWMIRVTMNVCLTHLRAAKYRRHVSLDAPAPSQGRYQADSDAVRPIEPPDAPHRELSPELRVQQEDAHRQVADALLRIEPDHRAILVLRDVRGLDYDQIAVALGIAAGTVKSRLFRARIALREAIENPTKKLTP